MLHLTKNRYPKIHNALSPQNLLLFFPIIMEVENGRTWQYSKGIYYWMNHDSGRKGNLQTHPKPKKRH